MTEIRWHEGTALHMQIKENKGVTWLTYPAFEQFKDIVHGFSTRLGGVSEGIYASMNLSFTREMRTLLSAKITGDLQPHLAFRKRHRDFGSDAYGKCAYRYR